MDFKEIKGKKHYLYDSLDEYKLHHSQVVTNNWRKGGEDEWVLTDDGYVCQILKSFVIGKSECVRTVCGTFRRNYMNRKMLGEEGIAEYIYSLSGTYVPKKDKKLNKRHYLFARYVARGDDVVDAYKKAYPKATSDDYIRNETTSLLKTENIKKMINEEIKEILDEEGATPKYLIRGYKQVADISEKDTDRLRALDSLAKISGLFDTQKQKTEELTVWAGFSPEQLESIKDGGSIEDGKAQLLAKGQRTTKEVQENSKED